MSDLYTPAAEAWQQHAVQHEFEYDEIAVISMTFKDLN